MYPVLVSVSFKYKGKDLRSWWEDIQATWHFNQRVSIRGVNDADVNPETCTEFFEMIANPKQMSSARYPYRQDDGTLPWTRG